MTISTTKHIVFFDLDGTLHQQDMFGCFLHYLLKHLLLNLLLVILILPMVGMGLLVKKSRFARWPVSLLLWSITFGRSEARLQTLQERFVYWFRQRVTYFPIVQHQLNTYLSNRDTQVWLITGSPKLLVEKVYYDSFFLPQVRLIGSQIHRRYGGWMLSLRCLSHEKVIQLKSELGIPLELYSGYSDSSSQDGPILSYCQYRWQVTRNGQLKQMD